MSGMLSLAEISSSSMESLVHHWLQTDAGPPAGLSVSEDVRSAVAPEAYRQMLLEEIRREELAAVLSAFQAADIPALLFKGTALAYSVYPRPHLRSRIDTDVLVRESDRLCASTILIERGYKQFLGVDGDLVSYQTAFCKVGLHGAYHVIDLHWRVSNPESFGHLFDFEGLYENSIALPALAGAARGAGDIDALLISCIHRVAHHHDDGHALWLYDIHLLTAGRSEAWFRSFAERARKLGVAQICARGLELAQARFKTQLPPELLLSLSENSEATGLYLTQGRRWYHDLRAEIQAHRSWSARLRFVLQHAFPKPGYMLAKYQLSSRVFLPLLYARRLLCGFPKLLRRRHD